MKRTQAKERKKSRTKRRFQHLQITIGKDEEIKLKKLSETQIERGQTNEQEEKEEEGEKVTSS